MCNSPVPVYVLGRHMLDAYFFEMEGTADLDFVICDVAKNSTSDRERIVDYSWLEFAKKPCFSPADSISSRVRALVRWIERSYTEKCTRELPEALRAHSKTMGFEYDVYLSSIVSHDGRRVEGVVQAVDSCVYITLAIPLLLEERARVQRNLSNVVELYSKVLQLRLDTVPQFSRVEISLIISCCANSRDAPVDVLSERISMDLGEPKNSTEVSFMSFITSCVKFRRIPRYSSTLQRGASFMDYIPLLERALFVSLREPLHFLELVCIMSSVFGRPISVNVATNYPGECGNGGDVSVRCATFCVVDYATQFGFCICVRYHNGWTLPSVCIIANQYTDGKSQGSPLQGKLQYSEDVRQLEKRCSNEEFLDVVALCEAIERGSFEVMAFLIAVCR
ncbi:hypothetical protein TCDM_09790 [Trypanosoma cruzi Dm28c]|uniref:Uncharacterized protein n=1 Tax=Trypanosoma cruzi Dm28c TaxID=1416333 RepID=V5B4P7_TRYCR|nr:hypothetical protein TCDM_09790 [Trypanosoma cruzi Dm28c]